MQELSGKIQDELDEREESEMLELAQEIAASNEAWQSDPNFVETPVTDEIRKSVYQNFIDTLPKEKRERGGSRIGVTKKVYRPAAEKKARKLAKKMRKANRRH